MSERGRMRQGQGRGLGIKRRSEATGLRLSRDKKRLQFEPLEERTLLAILPSPGAPVDVTRLNSNQFWPAIAVNPLAPNNIVVVSGNQAAQGSQFPGLSESTSSDGGKTWNSRIIADGFGSMVPALGEPTLTYDQFGNLFLSYLDSTHTGVVVAFSTDNGQNFKCFATLTSDFPFASGEPAPTVDRPTIGVGPGGASAPGSVWVSYQSIPPSGALFVAKVTLAGAPVFGLGNVTNTFQVEAVPEFDPPLDNPTSLGGNFTSLSVGANGQVTVGWQIPSTLAGPSSILTSIDADGLGPGQPSLGRFVTNTAVGGFDFTPPQTVQFIDASLNLIYDNTHGIDSHPGRLYAVYTAASSTNAGCTEIAMQFSDDNGATWSPPVLVSDTGGETAEILPQASLDPVTGDLAVGWLSARNDPGFGPGDRDGRANDDVEEFVSISQDGGATFSKNVQVATAPSSAIIAQHAGNNDFGRRTGMAIFNDVLYPAWPDNSVGLRGNPDPNNFDIAVAVTPVGFLTALPGQAFNGFTNEPLLVVVATFTDNDPDANTRTTADYTATIHWGDGTDTTGTVALVSGTTYTVTGTHTYTSPRNYAIGVDIQDNIDHHTVSVADTASITERESPGQNNIGLTPGPVTDISKLGGNQSEVSDAIDPVNPNIVVAVSNNNGGKGLFEGISNDGGRTWTQHVIADGFGTMVPANTIANPQVAFDEFGNLFLSYVDLTHSGVVVAISSDGGQSFRCFDTVTAPFPHTPGFPAPQIDRPVLAVGHSAPGVAASVWIAFSGAPNGTDPRLFGEMFAAGAQIKGLGVDQVSTFGATKLVTDNPGSDLGAIAVGPGGEVAVSWQNPVDLAGPSQIFTAIDTHGLNPGEFLTTLETLRTQVGGFDLVPPQPQHKIDATIGLAFDNSNDENRGRLYIVYTDDAAINAGCTVVLERHIDLGIVGGNVQNTAWSPSVQVSVNGPGDPAESAEILPRIAVDPVSGNVGVSWLSARKDVGAGPGDRDGRSNDDVEEFASVSFDGGVSFNKNQIIGITPNGNPAPSESAIAGFNAGQDFGAFTGLAMFDNVLIPAWPDNSTTLQGNPDPNNFDIAVSRVTLAFLTATGRAIQATAGVPFSALVATFNDADADALSRVPSDFTAVINWGDGSSSNGIISETSPANFAVVGQHVYARAKTFPIVITITDKIDHHSVTTQGTATVHGVSPVIPFTPALGSGGVIDVNRQVGNQSEEAVAINPTNPNNIVIVANQNASVPTQNGALPVVVSVSFDGGTTWTTRNLTDGFGNLVPGFGDPSVAWDRFGNLFLSTLDSTKKLVAISLSTDGGVTFQSLSTFEAAAHTRNVADQPTVTVGPGSNSPGSVWLLFKDTGGLMDAVGAPVFGLGLVGQFAPQQSIPGSDAGNFGDINVGPDGQVMVTYQIPITDEGPSNIFTNVDPDGLGGAGFGASIQVPPFNSPLLPNKTSTTFVGGFDPIPAQSQRTIDAEAGLAYDRSGGQFNGRVYLVYTDASALRSPDTDIYVRFSDDNGATWSAPVRVNDDHTFNSQFFPKIAVDQTTGHVAIAWYDARNDPGFGPGDRDGHPNDDVEIFAAVSTNGGLSFSPNIQVQSKPSEAAIAGHNGGNDFGDYMGISFFRDVFYPAWADNSVGLPGNPDPNNFDIATAKVSVLFNIPVSGMPLPTSVTGVLANGNKVTNNNQPTFAGGTVPGSTVSLFAELAGTTNLVLVGTAIANFQGIWIITTTPLADGVYSFFVQATTPGGQVGPVVQILPGGGMGNLVVDTVGPVVTALSFLPSQGEVILSFQDSLSGLDTASVANPANFTLNKLSRPGQRFALTNIFPFPPALPFLPEIVVLRFNNGQRLRGTDYILRVLSGGVKDAAGNALDGEFFGIFPSGNHIAGGDFVARLDSVHNVIFPAQPVATPVVRTRHRAPAPRHLTAPHALTVARSSPVQQTAVHDQALEQVSLSTRRRRHS